MYLIIANRCFSLPVVKVEHVIIVVVALNAAKLVLNYFIFDNSFLITIKNLLLYKKNLSKSFFQWQINSLMN